MVSTAILGGVATISFGGTPGNSLPGALLGELAATVSETDRRSDVNVIVIRSDGDGPFCAGASFDELKAIANEADGKKFFLGFAGVILAMTRAVKPVVVRVQGKAVGGGVGIIAAADYAIAARAASIRLSELAVGIGPFVVGPVIEHKIGVGAYGAMALDAEWRDAEWAEQHGLYAQVVETTYHLDTVVTKFADNLAASNPDAVAKIKRTVWANTDHWPNLLDERAGLSGSLVLSDFTKRAIAAFGKR